MLKYRLITALILIPAVIAALFFLPLLGFSLVTLAVCMLAAWEWGQLAGFVSYSQRIWLALLFGLLLAVMLLTMPAYQRSVHMMQVAASLWSSVAWWCLALVMVLSYPASALAWRHSRILRLVAGMLTIIPFFWGMVALRQLGYEANSFTGAWWLLYVMLLVWGADSGAYVFGKLFGRHKLAPKISPGKTWEGLIGGLASSALISVVFNHFVPLTNSGHILLICSIVAVLASVLGDLTESMFKREAGVKDSSHLIPGHGGVMDRIDSLTAAVPVFSCLMLLLFNAV
ncbi:CDP-diglyceride synthetase [Lonsdalea populi]|uniref:Phosphatidate cytidylyltransferase n=1 Tax=Lonsdalea populi TaxID=1172565 RepID=A0A3N0UIH5_9GAMM|nr:MULTISPECIES: phosphatidate cytidylyltransferase [Lonsdalea]OSM98109.1 CDP-diglyceride synthetase [Lonsdalea populi]RAT14894.1 CDP-diglyceride synthetase [Lonsdalea quercina]RAT29069.1 CDP-diglyceride synthetase [Lonsdalea populi]RAT36853.1 CDP-diglyceride synthetase [Lonsdalea populi]RAT43654.1 CDP-diglyceride synthetase [Lonsdalea populi]